MALIQEVKNGQIVESVSTSSTNKSTEQAGGTLDYDAFLQILCAEMQYQDPLEPTSNTEYIAQLATFSQLESNLSMQRTMEASSANDLVGKYVIMKVTSSTTGETNYASGIVDYVMHQNGKTYLSIEDSLYSLDDLDTVADYDYVEAVSIAEDFATAVNKLPSKNEITLAYKDTIQQMRATYDALSSYQKSFIDADAYKSFQEKEARLNELIKAAEEAEESNDSSDSTDESGETTGDTVTDTTGA